MKTVMPALRPLKDRTWFVVDAKGQTLGRLASQIAPVLSGKNRVDFAGHLDNGDYVIVVNAAEVGITGNKGEDKIYRRHSGFMGGLKETPFNEMKAKKPTEMVKLAVSGMLPKNKLRDGMLQRLKLFPGAEHPYASVNPKSL